MAAVARVRADRRARRDRRVHSGDDQPVPRQRLDADVGTTRVDDGARGVTVTDPAPPRPYPDQLIGRLTATDTRWAAATVGSHSSGAFQLSSRRPSWRSAGSTVATTRPRSHSSSNTSRDGQIAYFVVDDRGPGGSSHGPGGAPGGYARRKVVPGTVVAGHRAISRPHRQRIGDHRGG